MDRKSILARRDELFSRRDYPAASALERAFLREHPDDVIVHRKAAKTYAAMQDWPNAIACQLSAIELAPQSFDLVAELAKLYARSGMTSEAEDAGIRADALRKREAATLAQNIARAREDSSHRVAAIISAVLPVWEHALSRETTPRFASAFQKHIVDSVPGWKNYCPDPVEKGAIVDLELIGKFIVGNPDQVLHKRLSRRIPWELPVAVLLMELASRIDPQSLIVEVGANIGTITIPVARSTQATVLAYEPVDTTFQDLQANIRLNSLTNVDPFNMACSDREGWGEMTNVADSNPGLARLDESRQGPVRIATLDRLVEGRRVGLIKLDVEGHEEKVIAGAAQTIKHCRPLILCELRAQQAEGLRSRFAGLGYASHRVFRSDWLFVPEQ